MNLVLNWLWQGLVVATVAGLVLRAIDPWRGSVRYRVLAVAWFSVLLLPLAPLAWGMPASAPVFEAATSRITEPMLSVPRGWWTSPVFWLALWSVWCIGALARLAGAFRALRRIASTCHPVSPEMEAHLPGWARLRTTGRRARLLVSDAMPAAAVIGCGRPAIVLAPRLFEALTLDEIDHIVIHEWAHVQRRDDLANICQIIVRTLVGWHPALWWLDGRLRVEREVACDERSVAITGSAKAYATCLTRLASLTATRSMPALAAVSAAGLGDRVVRILAHGRKGSGVRWRAFGVAGAVAPLLAALVVGGVRLIEADSRARVEPPGLDPVVSVVARHDPMLPSESSVAAAIAPLVGMEAWVRASMVPTSEVNPGDLGRDDRVLAIATSHRPALLASVPPADPLPAPPSVLDARIIPATLLPPSPPLETPAAAPWSVAADSGLAIGRGSQRAAVATAGFFARVGRSIAGSSRR
jgi:beta-lactamase regulating signal transducer with metallopeptidase domain